MACLAIFFYGLLFAVADSEFVILLGYSSEVRASKLSALRGG